MYNPQKCCPMSLYSNYIYICVLAGRTRPNAYDQWMDYMGTKFNLVSGRFTKSMALILESWITLVHLYSRNKSDKDNCLFLFLFLLHDIYGNDCEIYMLRLKLLLTIFSVFSRKNSCKNKSWTKSSLWSQIYSWTKFIPLSRIRANVSRIALLL